MPAPAVYAARWVAPVASPPVADGAVAVDAEGRIAYVGPRAGAPAATDDLGDAVLLPGFVDANLACALPWGEGTAAVYARLRAGRLHGVTTVGLAIGDAETALHQLAVQRLRGTVYAGFAGPAPADRVAAFAALRSRVAVLRAELATRGAAGRVRVGVRPHPVHKAHEDLLLDACAWAVAEDAPVAVAVGESQAEVAFLREARGPLADALRARGVDVQRRAHSAVHLLAELGIAAVARPLLLLGPHVDDGDLALAAHYDCSVVRPAAPDHGAPPPRALLGAGLRVALGSPAVHEVDLTALPACARALVRAALLTPAEALHLLTLGGARALGLDDEIGSLEPGKQADLAAFPLRGGDDADPAAAVFARPDDPRAVLTVVAGEVVARRK